MKKIIVAWSGSAKQLLRILNLRAVVDYEKRASKIIKKEVNKKPLR